MKLQRILEKPPPREKSSNEQDKQGKNNRSDPRSQNTGPRRSSGVGGPSQPSAGKSR